MNGRINIAQRDQHQLINEKSAKDIKDAWTDLQGNVSKEEFAKLRLSHVWHHDWDGKTLELIPKVVHDSFRHTGGDALRRANMFTGKDLAWGVAGVIAPNVTESFKENQGVKGKVKAFFDDVMDNFNPVPSENLPLNDMDEQIDDAWGEIWEDVRKIRDRYFIREKKLRD